MPNDAFTLAVQCGGCGVSILRQRPRARFRRAALASVAIRPHGQRECASPAPLATPRAMARGLNEYRGVPRSPRGHKNPRGSRLAVCSMGLHRVRCGPSCQWRGVCPRHRDCGDSGTGLRPFRRPRRRQPTTLPLAARWMAAPYHAVTRAARAAFLAIPLPPLARRPHLPPVTTPFAPIRTPSPAGVVTGGRHVNPPPSPRRPSDARRVRPCARPGIGPDLAKLAAWAALGIVAPASCVRAAGVEPPVLWHRAVQSSSHRKPRPESV